MISPSTSIVSLASGAITLALFRRGLDYFPWAVGYLLLLWLAGVVFAHVSVVRSLLFRGRCAMVNCSGS